MAGMMMEVAGWGSRTGQIHVLSDPQILDLSCLAFGSALLVGTRGMCTLDMGGL